MIEELACKQSLSPSLQPLRPLLWPFIGFFVYFQVFSCEVELVKFAGVRFPVINATRSKGALIFSGVIRESVGRPRTCKLL